MADNYTIIVKNNLKKFYGGLTDELVKNLPGQQEGQRIRFPAFGEECEITPDGVRLGDREHSPVFGILITLYALNARPDECVVSPLRSFKEFPDSAPYVGAFTTHTEQLIAPHAELVKAKQSLIMEKLHGREAPQGVGGDFSFLVYPLPKIALCYIFYEADEDFPAAATCLYSHNARLFLPVDGLADVGEYTSRKMLELCSS